VFVGMRFTDARQAGEIHALPPFLVCLSGLAKKNARFGKRWGGSG